MPDFNVDSKECPVCHMAKLVKNGGADNVRGSTHHCEHCHAKLKVATTVDVLWTIPIIVITAGVVYLAFQWVRSHAGLPGVVRGGLIGGVGSLCFGISLGVARRGLVFRQA